MARVGQGLSLYEVSSRAWMYELGVTSLDDVPDAELDKLQEQKMHMIWLQGAFKLGSVGLALDREEKSRMEGYKKALPDFTPDDIIGSPYAIVEYVVSDELGGNAAMARFRERCAKRGLKLMLDFVPNHMAVDCAWADDPACRDFFIRKPDNPADCNPDEFLPDGRAHGKDPYTGAWPDTAQLNYFNPALREAQVDNLLRVASICDVMRLDMAMLLLNKVHEQTWGRELRATGWSAPPTEFWEDAIKRVRAKYPDTIFMAEVYWGLDTELVGLGFDLTYDKYLYDHLASGHMDNLRGYMSSRSLDFLRHSAHFVENHDEPRAVSEFCGPMRANAAAAISFLLPGCRLIFHDQWHACSARLDVHLRRRSEYESDAGTLRYYTVLNKVLAEPAFTEPDAGYHWTWPEPPDESDYDTWRLVAWRMTHEDDRFLVVVNYTDAAACARFKLPDAPSASPAGEYTVHEYMAGKDYPRDAGELREHGLHCVMKPWGVQIFKY
ncbi:hypothetical protein FVE85_2613 [Porphyridium purpureum]|uniref:Glycosyl hydrolase family 13 catalytic domain-containing protein n=1 Tax=Porphyridium purpureum TaxID=35688 RepID=A0A5J4YU60_PORPP|nr:hypothetical protein FVE85_2613 [Porphyridium purpureum]|eukprot:POR9142..scf227_4